MRAASALVVAVGLGGALGVVVTSAGVRTSGVPGLYGFAVLVAACVYVGWFVAQFVSAPVSVVASPSAVLVMIAVLLGVKVLRLPSAPLVGDGFEIFVVMYAGAGAVGALLGRARSLRLPELAAARTGLWLTAAALVISATTFALDAVIGS